MKTFFNILQTVINLKHKTYPDEPFSIPETPYETQIIEEHLHIGVLINRIYYEVKKNKYDDKYKNNSHSKFCSLNHIVNNSFYQTELKEKLFGFFSKAQKHYFAFSRLAYIYKFKKYKIVVSDDLLLNSLDINHKNTFVLMDNKSKYLFSLNDLISIIETAIGNSPDFFSDPLLPNNPYNKQPLTNATLYNIYFKMKHSTRLMSTLFHFFFLEEFNLTNFSEHYEPYIRENSITKYVFNSHFTTLYSSVLTMLKSNQYTNLYVIHKDFPKEKLVDIFRPFLFYYYICNYDIKGTMKIYNYKLILHTKLKSFYQYNKTFGRRFIKITRMFNKPLKREYEYNSDHISFYKIPINNNYIYPYEPVARVATTINVLISNTMFNVSNNVYGDAYSADTYSEQDYNDSDSDDTNNNAVNTNILDDPEYEREFDELYNRFQTANIENNNNSNDTLDEEGSNYDDDDSDSEEEQNDDNSIS